MLSRTLINRPTVEKLMQMAQLETAGQTKAQRDALVDNLFKSLAIRSTGRDNLYTLSYRDENPERSLQVVKSLLTIFVESGKGAAGTDSDNARKFIEEQIKNYENKLSEAESRLKDFRLRNLDMQGQGGLDVAGRMAEMLSTLSQARLELREAESAREAARKQLEQARSMARTAPDTSSLNLRNARPGFPHRCAQAQPGRPAATLHGPAPGRAQHAPPDQGTGRPEAPRDR
ncbi:hypothetical protein ACFJI0_09710 [Hydrogenophaga sp. UC242_53]|uniref:hypothetical protein n=1 Tax=Hydrogenophaga sp. UC242_53 TaxID=3350170 RepID=UPI0036D35E40